MLSHILLVYKYGIHKGMIRMITFVSSIKGARFCVISTRLCYNCQVKHKARKARKIALASCMYTLHPTGAPAIPHNIVHLTICQYSCSILVYPLFYLCRCRCRCYTQFMFKWSVIITNSAPDA